MSGITVIKRRERERLFREQKGLCFYCSSPMLLHHGKWPRPGGHPPTLCTIDHIVPLSAGGAWSPASNAVAACRRCNSERGNRDARLFMLTKQGLIPAASAGIGSPDAQPTGAVEPGAGVGGGA